MEKKSFLARYSTFILPAVLVLLSFFLRLSLISKGPYSVDCLRLVARALKMIETGELQFLASPGYPLTVILAALFIWVGKMLGVTDPVLAVNFMSVVFSSLTVGVFFLLVRRLLNTSSAIFSACLLSVNPMFLALSVYGKSHMPTMFFLVLGTHFILSYQVSGRRKDFWFSAAALACAGATREQDLVLVFPALVYLFASDKDGSFWSGVLKKYQALLLWAGTIFFAVLLSHAPYFFQSNRDAYLRLFDRERDMVALGFLGILSPRLLVSGGFLADIFHPLGILGIVAGIVLLFKKARRQMFFLLLWVLCPLLFYGNLRMTVTPRYFVLFVPALVTCLGYALSVLFEKGRWGKSSAAVLLIVLVGLGMMRVVPNLKIRHDRAILPEFCRWVTDRTEKGARIIVADERYFMHYYGHRETMSRPMSMLRSTEQELEDFRAKVNDLLQQGIPVYFTTASLLAYDRDGHFSNFILDNYDLKVVGSHPYEDWHKGSLELQVFDFQLMKMSQKAL